MTKEEALRKIDELKQYVEELDKPVYKAGDRFKCNERGTYILATPSSSEWLLISLENGNRWIESCKFPVKSFLTKEEFSRVCDGRPHKFTLTY